MRHSPRHRDLWRPRRFGGADYFKKANDETIVVVLIEEMEECRTSLKS